MCVVARNHWRRACAAPRQPILDADNGRIALLRTMSDGVGGADLLTVRNGDVEPIWSLTGTRAFRY